MTTHKNKTIPVDPHSYKNLNLITDATRLIKKGKNIIVSKYNKKPTLYFLITSLKDIRNRILCIIGYSTDIVSDIYENLVEEYSCSMHLVGLKEIENDTREKEFHSYLKMNYPDLNIKYKLNNSVKDNVYIFDECLVTEFDNFLNIVHRIEAKNILSTVSQIIDFNEHHMNIFNNYISAYSNIAISEIESANLDKKYNYELKSKDKDIELEKLKLDGKKTELEILKLSKK